MILADIGVRMVMQILPSKLAIKATIVTTERARDWSPEDYMIISKEMVTSKSSLQPR